MKYTYYFGEITRDYGQPRFDLSQFKRMMNIIYLEGIVDGMEALKENLKGTADFYKFDHIIFRRRMKLTELTGNLKPQDLVKEMQRLSK